MHNSWCPLPWLSLEIRNNGDMRLCPHSHQGKDNGLLRKADGTVYNGSVDDLDEARNCQLMQDVRKDMLAGNWHPACSRCQTEHAAGLPSANQTEIEIWKEHIDFAKAARVTEADGRLDVDASPLKHYGLRFGNKCNLKCRSCNPTESDFWYEDYTRLWDTNKYTESFGIVELVRDGKHKLIPVPNRYDWYKTDSFWQQIHDNSENILHVHLAGGEPTIIMEQYAFLQRCINLGIADKMIIEYNTNCTNIPNRAWHLWECFREVRIGASIDGIGMVNDYIRHPSNWEDVETNIVRFDTDAKVNFNPWIASTVMIYNIWHIPDMLDWAIDKSFKRVGKTEKSPLIWFHPLYGPKHLNVRILPDGVKREIHDLYDRRLPDLLNKVQERYACDLVVMKHLQNGVRDHLNKWLDFMDHPGDTSLMKKFWYFTDRLDATRGESMQQAMPEFYDLLERHR